MDPWRYLPQELRPPGNGDLTRLNWRANLGRGATVGEVGRHLVDLHDVIELGRWWLQPRLSRPRSTFPASRRPAMGLGQGSGPPPAISRWLARRRNPSAYGQLSCQRPEGIAWGLVGESLVRTDGVVAIGGGG
jgi:hypothetical protein